ncbi:MAG TPA: O-antigen ligase family protein [Pyrinomonadaceae bacterium]|nr:O-antigen ligase family protein [Pyrinomonadaceae bacterium]
MAKLLAWLDSVATTSETTGLVRWLDRGAFFFATLMVLASPHSIAATQIAWGIGMLFWIVRSFVGPRTKRKFCVVSIALFALFGWSVISAALSYEPAVSLDRLRGVSVFLIFIFVAAIVRNLQAIYFLAFAMIISCMVNVAWTPVERLIGRGVEIHGLRSDSPLAKALLSNGDTLLSVGKVKLKTPEEVVAAIEANETTKITFYRPDFEFAVNVKRADLLSGTAATERLGIESWKLSHNWRSKGFYSHYVTYAEVLQLIGSLILGFLIAALVFYSKQQKWTIPLLSAAFLGTSFALLLTVTRASQLALMISGFAMVVRGGGRKLAIAATVIAIPVVIVGLIFLQQSRNTGFFDPTDESTRYRFVMWNDGGRLLTESPRNFIFGIGMDSVQKRWQEWNMYEGGNLPMGHFHSTPVQIAVERGIPALLIWIAILAILAKTLWRGITSSRTHGWRSYGVALGTFGALIGFVASGFVHWNLGDQEVAMVFYMLMAFGVRVSELTETSS